jgi:hypothetical protein
MTATLEEFMQHFSARDRTRVAARTAELIAAELAQTGENPEGPDNVASQ